MRTAWLMLLVLWSVTVVAVFVLLVMGCDRDALPAADMATRDAAAPTGDCALIGWHLECPDLGRCGYNWMPCCQTQGEPPCWDATACFRGTCAVCGLAGLPCCPPGTPGVTGCVLPATCGGAVCR